MTANDWLVLVLCAYAIAVVWIAYRYAKGRSR